MFQYTVTIPLALACACAANAYRSRVHVTRLADTENGAIRRSQTRTYLWDVQSTYPEVISFSDYFLSLKFDRPLNLRGLLIALAFSKFRNSMLMKLVSIVLIGVIPFIGYVRIADRPIQLLELLESFLGFYSMGIFASIADGIHHIKPFKIKPGEDAISKFKQRIRCEAQLPHYDPLDAFPRVLDSIPDVIKLVHPDPFLPELLPGLCIGWGGLKPLQTQRTAMRNALVAEMLNRLSANLLVSSGVLEASDLFVIKWEGDTIKSVDEFARKIPGISLCFTKNSSSFGFMVCVKEGEEQYRQLPLAWPARMAIRDPETGDQITAFAYHSSLVMIGSSDCPLGNFRAQFFLGPEGLTGWKAGNEYIKPWAPLVSSHSLTDLQVVEACRAATCTACAINLASRTQDLAVGGYALHGTCLDTVAIIKTVVLGSFDDFPMVASGDARAGTIAACYHLSQQLQVGESLSWAKDMFDRIGRIVEQLPDDTSLPPDTLISALDRLSASVTGDFVRSFKLKENLKVLRIKWKKILHSE